MKTFEQLRDITEQTTKAASPYFKAGNHLLKVAKTLSGEDKETLEYHGKLLKSPNKVDHKSSAKGWRNYDTFIRDHIADAVHKHSDAEHSAEWHKHAGATRLKN